MPWAWAEAVIPVGHSSGVGSGPEPVTGMFVTQATFILHFPHPLNRSEDAGGLQKVSKVHKVMWKKTQWEAKAVCCEGVQTCPLSQGSAPQQRAGRTGLSPHQGPCCWSAREQSPAQEVSLQLAGWGWFTLKGPLCPRRCWNHNWELMETLKQDSFVLCSQTVPVTGT